MRILNQMALLLERKLLSFPAAQQVDPRYLVLQTSWKMTALPPRKMLFMGKMGRTSGGLGWGILSWKKGSEKHSERL